MTPDMLNFDPDPKVLLALTHTPLKPLDALCELIDNGLDSFMASKLQGSPVRHPLLKILVPGESEARRGEGVVRIVDNGAGLDRSGLSNALRAGYSDKNKFDTLGLFGMGFNIATGKLGRRTTVTTARASDDFALRVVVDLPRVVASRKFEAPVEQIRKPPGFDHGTIIEVSDWWPQGDPNSGFVVQLARISKPQLRDQIGRRYATALRNSEDGVRIVLNDEFIEGFEHCVWSPERFVERREWGRIPARYEFDTVIRSQRRCQHDGTLVEGNLEACIECGRSDFRTVEERVRGWVGIQRFDDNDRFGIDLIRNGRAIRVGEKDAFFNYTAGLESIKEYPTDQQTGRIVGEVHLDHVPVDFQKQDFQRSSEEWVRAIHFLRGDSLLPSKWADTRNETPVSKLFQGYRKVRKIGREDMYMGRWDPATGKAVRIPRDVEEEYYQRFLAKEEGYYDDAKWWELVESAGVPPVPEMPECPDCGFQNLPERDECEECGRILHGKKCLECSAEIPNSAITCSHCGSSQIPDVREPWQCNVCGETNGVDDERCGRCNSLRGEDDPMSEDSLRQHAEKVSELSFGRRTFELADGNPSEPLSVQTFRIMQAMRPVWNGESIPTYAIRSTGSIDFYIDIAHPLFAQLGVKPEEAVAVEAAQYLHSMRSDLAGRPAHSVQNIAARILADVWGDSMVMSPSRLRDLCRGMFDKIADRLGANPDASDFYDELDQFEQRELADKLISESALDRLPELRASGGWLKFAPPGVVTRFFVRKPDAWFGTVWNEHLPAASEVGDQTAQDARTRTVGVFTRCLQDCADYLRFNATEAAGLMRVQASYEYLEDHLV